MNAEGLYFRKLTAVRWTDRRSAGKARRPVQTGVEGRACARDEAPHSGSGRRRGEDGLAGVL